MKGIRGKNSADFVRNPYFGCGKIFAGIMAWQYWDGTGSHGSMKGWYSEKNKKYLVERVNDQLPYLHQMWNESSRTGMKNDFGETLLRRGVFCLPNNMHHNGLDELSRFQQEDFASTHDAIEILINNETAVLPRDSIEQLQEKMLTLKATGPCVYLRWTHRLPTDIDIGSTYCLMDRSKQHHRSPQSIAVIFSFPTIEIARQAEYTLHDYMKELEGVRSKTQHGYYITNMDNILDVVKDFAVLRLRRFMHNTGTGMNLEPI
jgi:hypothetical protein